MRKLGLLLGLLGGCRTMPEVQPRESARFPIAIVTLDGVRAEDARALPQLAAVAERGRLCARKTMLAPKI